MGLIITQLLYHFHNRLSIGISITVAGWFGRRQQQLSIAF